jgi:hypothetical protein
MILNSRGPNVSRFERVGIAALGAVTPVLGLALISAATHRGTHYSANGRFFRIGLWLAPLLAVSGLVGVMIAKSRLRIMAVGFATGSVALTLFVWAGLALFMRNL